MKSKLSFCWFSWSLKQATLFFKKFRSKLFKTASKNIYKRITIFFELLLKGQSWEDVRISSTLWLCLTLTHTQLAVVGCDWGAVGRVGLSSSGLRPVLQTGRQRRECCTAETCPGWINHAYWEGERLCSGRKMKVERKLSSTRDSFTDIPPLLIFSGLFFLLLLFTGRCLSMQ